MTYLPDVNVWIALAVPEHVHHGPARAWLEASADHTFAFCRITEMALLRLLTNAHVMSGAPLTPAQAWNVRDAFLVNNRIEFAAEPAGFEREWRDLTESRKTGANFWTDAYLGGFASAAGYTLVTFDAGLKQPKRARVLLLS